MGSFALIFRENFLISSKNKIYFYITMLFHTWYSLSNFQNFFFWTSILPECGRLNFGLTELWFDSPGLSNIIISQQICSLNSFFFSPENWVYKTSIRPIIPHWFWWYIYLTGWQTKPTGDSERFFMVYIDIYIHFLFFGFQYLDFSLSLSLSFFFLPWEYLGNSQVVQ